MTEGINILNSSKYYYDKVMSSVDPNLLTAVKSSSGFTLGNKTWKVTDNTSEQEQVRIFREVYNKLNDGSDESEDLIKSTGGFRFEKEATAAINQYEQNVVFESYSEDFAIASYENKQNEADATNTYRISCKSTNELGTITGSNDPKFETLDKDKNDLITSGQYLDYLTKAPSGGGYIYDGAATREGNDMINGILKKSPNMEGILRTQTPPQQQDTVKMLQEAEKHKALIPLSTPDEELPTDQCERISLGDSGNTTLALNVENLPLEEKKKWQTLAKTDAGKKFVTSDNGLKDVSDNEANSQGVESDSDQNNGGQGQELGKNDKKIIEDFDLKKYKENSQKYKLSIGGHDDIPYFKVKGYNKIRFPNVWDNGPYHIPIMGLPPTRIQKDITQAIPFISTDAFGYLPTDSSEDIQYSDKMFVYNEDEQLKNSFLKLTIHPIDAEFFQGGANDKENYYEERRSAKQKALKNGEKNQYDYQDRSVVLWDVDYKFAIEAKNDYTISHSNTYNSNSVESTLNRMDGISNLVNEINGMSQTSGGAINMQALSGMGQQMASQGMQTIDQMLESLTAGSSGLELGSHKNAFLNFVRDVSKIGTQVLTGARIDMADVWTSSTTAVRYNFEINLRTLNPDPLSIQYCKDILLPLYILYSLALPTDVARIGYKTPPYIYCNVDKFLKIKIGGIENLQVTIPSSEVNFRRAPRHVKVNLTIRDLYSVMKQNSYDMNNALLTDNNGDTTDKDEFVNNFVEYALDMKKDNRTVVNEPYYLTEFCKIPAYMNALNQYIANKQAELDKAKEDAGENTDANKNKPKQENTTTKADTDKASGNKSDADKEIKAEKGKNGKTNIITSINGVVTGIVKGVKNVVAEVNKAIQPVRGLINTGRMILNTASNLKSAFKLVGSTANLQGILNGQFASSIGFTFNNLANATDIVTGLCDGVFSGGSAKEILKNLGELPQRIATNNMARLIDGNSMDLSSNFRDMGIMMYGVANGLGSTYASMSNLKYMGQQDTLGKLKTIFGGLSAIANGSDYITKQMAWQNNAGVIRGLLTSGQVTNAKTQERLQEVAQSSTEKLQESLSSKYVLGVDKNTGHYGLIPKDSVSDKSFNPNNTFKFDYDKGTWK